jgi:CheY-like chemotaxis protein
MYKALIADDDPAVLQTLKMLFEARHFEVFAASSAQDAISALATAAFDLVVTDMRMESETSGFDVLRTAKVQKHKPVVVILSAYPIPAAEWRAAGADAMFMKGGGAFHMIDDIEHILTSQPSAQRSAS